uniref:Glycosyltransferase n=1 Tax=viral metagenome TaxID=1070528 RepID=A0A6C0EMT5_9ZZZZ
MKRVAIITENFLHPWSPNELEEFLGGSQECVVLLAEALSRIGHNIKVFMIGPTECKEEKRKGILYKDFSKFSLDDVYDTIIMFKVNPLPNDSRLKDVNLIFWSSDVETRPENRYINTLVCLTDYHKNRCGWDDAVVIPHGIDILSLQQNRVPKMRNTMLYCSSLDRGLNTLIENWKKIKEKHPDLRLYITYGYKIAKQICSGLGELLMEKEEEDLKKVCNDLDIKYFGAIGKDDLEQLYWMCEYWCLPLTNADSELFCFNAIKSQICLCTPVIYREGALTETVGPYIDFDDFVNGQTYAQEPENGPYACSHLRNNEGRDYREHPRMVPVYTWDEVVRNYWSKII